MMRLCLVVAFLLSSVATFTLAAVILPTHKELTLPTAHKLVCVSPTSLKNAGPVAVRCVNGAKVKVHVAISGLQSREVCPQSDPPAIAISNSCDEVMETSRIVQEKCNGQDTCLIDFVNELPHNCASDVYSYVNVTYSCLTSKIPFKAFAKERGLQNFNDEYDEEEDEEEDENDDNGYYPSQDYGYPLPYTTAYSSYQSPSYPSYQPYGVDPHIPVVDPYADPYAYDSYSYDPYDPYMPNPCVPFDDDIYDDDDDEDEVPPEMLQGRPWRQHRLAVLKESARQRHLKAHMNNPCIPFPPAPDSYYSYNNYNGYPQTQQNFYQSQYQQQPAYQSVASVPYHPPQQPSAYYQNTETTTPSYQYQSANSPSPPVPQPSPSQQPSQPPQPPAPVA